MGDIMGFSETIKKEVKEKAAFRCCRCQNIGIHIHHIIPQKDGGSDDIDNAAPLCPNCHNDFGDNSEKRKEIHHMRDWWYNQVEIKYPKENRYIMILEDINRQSLLNELESNYENKFYEMFKSNDLNILYTITPINFEDRTIQISEKLQKIIEENLPSSKMGKIFQDYEIKLKKGEIEVISNNEKWGNSIFITEEGYIIYIFYLNFENNSFPQFYCFEFLYNILDFIKLIYNQAVYEEKISIKLKIEKIGKYTFWDEKRDIVFFQDYFLDPISKTFILKNLVDRAYKLKVIKDLYDPVMKGYGILNTSYLFSEFEASLDSKNILDFFKD